MIATRTTRLAARFSFAALLGLGLAGGIAGVAGAAPAPTDGSSPQVSVARPVGPGDLVADPGRVPILPLVPVDPDPCKGKGDGKSPCSDPCTGRDPSPKCRPDPCKGKGKGKLDDRPRLDPKDPCANPCEGSHPSPKCDPDPCAAKKGKVVPSSCNPGPCDPPKGTELPRRCQFETCDVEPGDTCDPPVPAKPTFTG